MVGGKRRLFASITKVSKQFDKTDHVLGFPLLRLTTNTETVGLPAMAGKKLYIVPMGEDELLNVNWDIQFL